MTILERIQAKYLEKTKDARNIAEAIGMAFGTAGRGATNIADVLYKNIVITFKPNGGTGDDFTINMVTGQNPMPVPECPFTPPEGKAFDFWFREASAAGAIEQMKLRPPTWSKGSYNGNATLYAIWKDVETFTFDPNGGGGTAFSEAHDTNADGVLFPECPFTAPEGKAFKDWLLPGDGVESLDDHVEPGMRDYVGTGDATFYANWADTETFTYDPNGGGGTAFTETHFTDADDVVYPQCPFTAPSNNQVFLYWALAGSSEEHGNAGDPNYNVGGGNLTFLAVWSNG